MFSKNNKPKKPRAWNSTLPAPTKPLKSKSKSIARKAKFHASEDRTKIYARKRSEEDVRSFAEQCRDKRLSSPTEAETAFASILRELGIDYERERIFYYAGGQRFCIADFFLVLGGRDTIIEIDGEELHKQQKSYDEGRDRYFASIGIQTIRFGNREILKESESVKETLNHTSCLR